MASICGLTTGTTLSETDKPHHSYLEYICASIRVFGELGKAKSGYLDALS